MMIHYNTLLLEPNPPSSPGGRDRERGREEGGEGEVKSVMLSIYKKKIINK